MVIGRTTDLATALGMLQNGGSIDVVGSRGSGRTAFLAALRTKLEGNDWRVISVRGVASLRQHPLAAMHLAGIGGPSDPRISSTIQSTTDALTEMTRPDRSVLFLDDWDDLDESSWGVAEAVRRRTGLPIVISRLQGLRARHTPSGLNASTLEPSYVIELAPLRFEELEQALADHLGGPIETGTMSRLYAKSGGIVGLARSVVDAGVREGRLVQAPTGWSATRDLWSPGLRGILEAHLENLGDDARDALEIIALVGVADVETVRKLISWETLELLEERAMVKLIASASRQLVTVVPPLLVEFFRNQPLATRRIRLTELIIERLGATNPVNVLIANTSALSRDVSDDDALFVRLLQERARTRRIVTQTEWLDNPKPSTAVQYIEALLQLRDTGEEIRKVFATTDGRLGGQEGQARFISLRAEWRAIVDRDLDGALAELTRSTTGLGDFARVLDATAVRIETLMRAVPEDFAARLEVTEVLPASVATTLREAQLLILISLGRFSAARRVFEAIDSVNRNNSGSVANQLNGYLLLGEGKYDAAMRWAHRGLDEAHGLLDPDATLAHGTLAALGFTISGDYPGTEHLLDTLFAVGEPSPLLVHTHLALLSIATVVAVRRGQLQLGERYYAEVLALDLVDGPLPVQSRVWPATQLTAFNGQALHAAAELWDEGDRLWKRGARFTAALAGLTSTEISGDQDQLSLVRQRVEELDSGYLAPHLEYLEARAQESAEPLLDATESLMETGRPGLALSAYEQAIEHLRAAGEAGRADEVDERRQELVEEIGADSMDTTRFLAAAITLTDRELEIAQLVSEGLPNKEIAGRLVLSVRTVESHMRRIIRKTGIPNRAALSEYVHRLNAEVPLS
ncbi:helix-turn-helix domain-containing protein [Leucobacter luti]|nr:helix-turn-helix transcriptional regulator [Leucobacter luti]